MSNIRNETKRHDWIYPITLDNVSGSSFCRNCRKTVYGKEPSETNGCLFETKTANYSRDKMKDLTEFEMGLRQREQKQDEAYLKRMGLMDGNGKLIQR